MSTYEDIFGKRVKFFDEDPTLDSTYEGQVWYNSATGILKSVVKFGAFASAPSLNTGRTGSAAAKNSPTSASLAFGGFDGGPSLVALVEEFNGSSWSEVNNLPGNRDSASGTGIQTAALSTGGNPAGVTGSTGS